MTPEEIKKEKSQCAANEKIRLNNRNKMTPEEIQNQKSKHATNEQTRWTKKRNKMTPEKNTKPKIKTCYK